MKQRAIRRNKTGYAPAKKVRSSGRQRNRPRLLTLPQIGGEKMNEYTLDYVERNRLDAFCKTVLRNEARSHLSELTRRRDREKPLDTLPQAEMDGLCALDEYPSDSFTFSAFGYDLHIRDERVAGAFASLPEQEQQILILRFVAALADGEIGGLVGMSAAPSSGTAQSP